MSKKKETRGGTRAGAGAPLKYGEPTTPVVIRVPVSKVADFKKYSNKKLLSWQA
jgi:hypothetical protein